MSIGIKITIPRLSFAPDRRALRSAVYAGAAAIAKQVRGRLHDGKQADGTPIPAPKDGGDPMERTGQTIRSIAARRIPGASETTVEVRPDGYHGGPGRTKAIRARDVDVTALAKTKGLARIKAMRKAGIVPTSLIVASQNKRRNLDLVSPDAESGAIAEASVGRELARQEKRLLKQTGAIEIAK